MNHISVLYAPALEHLAIRPDGVYVDATFGAGGHSRGILEQLGPTGRLIALDADPDAVPRAAQIQDPRFTLVSENFRRLDSVLDDLAIGQVDGVLFDLGVSSMQFDVADRGFSLQHKAPLDMRMNPYTGRSAFDVLEQASERELADIFYLFGEERAARRIAHAIVARRENGTLPATTTEFAGFISGVLHRPGKRERIHPATRVFQALRIAVNEELDALREGVAHAINRLGSAGRIVAISFHSLEDRIVKQSFRGDERLSVITRKPLIPDDAEMMANPRARSAKLRAAERKAS